VTKQDSAGDRTPGEDTVAPTLRDNSQGTAHGKKNDGEGWPADTISVPEAGRRLGLGKNAAYEAAGRGEIPVLRFGRLLRVPRVAFQRMLAEAGSSRGK
jgi:excisionase family DNA binding protein